MPVNPHVREGRTGSNRSYRAMKPEKLKRCIKELEAGMRKGAGLDWDDAYGRCISKGGDPEVDLVVALEAWGEKVYDATPIGVHIPTIQTITGVTV